MTATPAPPDPWARLHPLTPLLRGGRIVILLLGVLGQQQLQRSGDLGVAGVIIGVGVVVALVTGWVSWLVTRYRVEAGDLRIESGLFVRRSRRVPLARLQAVDVVRPLLARMLGLAELRLEVVGHGQTEAPLAYLREHQAEQLRARLIALAAGWHEETPAAPEQPLVIVPMGALLASMVLGSPFVVLAVIVIGDIAISAAVSSAAPIAATVPLIIAPAAYVWRRLSMEWGFTLAESPDGFRLRHGLLETRAQTIPPGRVQALRVLEPWLWRPFGWVRVEIDVAGYRSSGRREQRRETTALLPVAPRALAVAVVARVMPGVDIDRLTLSRPPQRSRWRAPLSWHNLGYGWVSGHAVTRAGVLRRVTDVVPEIKVQSLRLVQGPLQRRLRIASVHFDTAGRDVHAVAAHRDVTEAGVLLKEGAERAQHARAVDLRWGRVS